MKRVFFALSIIFIFSINLFSQNGTIKIAKSTIKDSIKRDTLPVNNRLYVNNNGCDDCMIEMYSTSNGFEKKSYKKFSKDSCELKEYEDRKGAMDSVCLAKYYTSINAYFASIDNLK